MRPIAEGSWDRNAVEADIVRSYIEGQITHAEGLIKHWEEEAPSDGVSRAVIAGLRARLPVLATLRGELLGRVPTLAPAPDSPESPAVLAERVAVIEAVLDRLRLAVGRAGDGPGLSRAIVAALAVGEGG